MSSKILLSFAMLMILAYAASDDVGWFDLFNTTGWISLAAAVIIIHLLLVSLAYMVSYMLEDEEIKAWCRNEVMQAVFSAIIVASLVGALALVNGITDEFFVGIVNPQVSCEGPECHQLRTDLVYDPASNRWRESGNGLKVSVVGGKAVCTGPGAENCDPKFLMARSYLGITYEKLAVLLKNFMHDYSIYYSIDSFGFSTDMSILDQIFGISFASSFPLHSVLLNTLDNLIAFTEKIMMIIKFQESILKFFEFGLASGLIVLGILFRSIWVFRKAGGLFLAMGIGFMYVLPMLYALGWYTIDIKPMQEAGISESASMSGMGIPETGEEDFFETISELPDAFGDSTLGSALAMLLVIMGFTALRVAEIVKLVTTPGGILKTAIDVLVLISVLVAISSLNSATIKDANDLYTDYETGKVGAFDLISRYLIVALALPLINFYVLFSFIRGLSPLLGGDVEIPALGRLL